MGWCDRLDASSVCDGETFSEYCRQELGTQWPTKASHTKVQKFFDKKMDTDWVTVCSMIPTVRQATMVNKQRLEQALEVLHLIHDLTTAPVGVQ